MALYYCKTEDLYKTEAEAISCLNALHLVTEALLKQEPNVHGVGD